MGNAAREKWSLSQAAFDGLLSALGPDRDEAANRYLEIRANLVRLFEWRGCSTPDDLADEAINRCARKIEEGEQIRDVATYCVGVARMIVREMGRMPASKARPLDEVPEPRALPTESDSEAERREQCLRQCLSCLSDENRDLILRYYQGDGGDKIRQRKGLSQFFGVPANVLRMRALRLRERLLMCVEDCLRSSKKDFL